EKLEADRAELAALRERVAADQTAFDERCGAWERERTEAAADLDRRGGELGAERAALDTEHEKLARTREQLHADATRLDGEWAELRRAQAAHEAALAELQAKLDDLESQ